MTEETVCAICDRALDWEDEVIVRGLADVRGLAVVCRADLPDVLRRGSLRPEASLRVSDRLADIFTAPEDAA